MTGWASAPRPPGWTPENPDLSMLAKCLTERAAQRRDQITAREMAKAASTLSSRKKNQKREGQSAWPDQSTRSS
jgi:hypothetical protein